MDGNSLNLRISKTTVAHILLEKSYTSADAQRYFREITEKA